MRVASIMSALALAQVASVDLNHRNASNAICYRCTNGILDKCGTAVGAEALPGVWKEIQ